ncbi:MAG: acyl-[acyl-carrier-protein] thioesterase [Eubacterium sp.]|nr:acyl-[acyl-carrier-protein] thioesterase [Eubacterium sp.]
MFNEDKSYSFEARIRYSESDENNKLTVQGLMDYFQDCSIFHAEDAGYGVGFTRENHLVWMVNFWQIIINDMPGGGDVVTIGTIAHDIKGFWGHRNFYLDDANGNRLAYGNSVWSHINTESMTPVRAPQEMKDAYGIGEKLDMDYAPRKIKIPTDLTGETLKPITVSSDMLDTNHHVNNGQYIKMAFSYLPSDLKLRELRVEYKKQAVLGDLICPVRYELEDGAIMIALNSAEGDCYCAVVVYKK